MVRKLAVIMHAIWSDGTFYVGDSARTEVMLPFALIPRIAGCWGRSMNGATEIETHAADTLTGAT